MLGEVLVSLIGLGFESDISINGLITMTKCTGILKLPILISLVCFHVLYVKVASGFSKGIVQMGYIRWMDFGSLFRAKVLHLR